MHLTSKKHIIFLVFCLILLLSTISAEKKKRRDRRLEVLCNVKTGSMVVISRNSKKSAVRYSTKLPVLKSVEKCLKGIKKKKLPKADKTYYKKKDNYFKFDTNFVSF